MNLFKKLFLSKEEKEQLKKEEKLKLVVDFQNQVDALNKKYKSYLGKPVMSTRQADRGDVSIFHGFSIHPIDFGKVGIKLQTHNTEEGRLHVYDYDMLEFVHNGDDFIRDNHQNWLNHIENLKKVGYRVSRIPKIKVTKESNENN